MATALKEGDHVQVADREASAEDSKVGLYYDYFRQLTGTIQKVYSSGEAAIEIDQSSLTEPVMRRHSDVQEQMKTKWLDGLSEEARSRLSEAERDFRLHYTILVNLKDLIACDVKSSGAARADQENPAPVTANPVADEPTRRATASDLDAAEEAELRRRMNQEN